MLDALTWDNTFVLSASPDQLISQPMYPTETENQHMLQQDSEEAALKSPE